MAISLARGTTPLAALALVIACGMEPGQIATDPDFGSQALLSSSTLSEWSSPENLGTAINTPFNEQGPTVSNDGLALYFGSDRPGGFGMVDIWVSRRACTDCPWEAPENLGPTVNSARSETGPSMSIDGHLLTFRSDRPGGQGLGDVWMSRRANPKDDSAWETPVPLGPGVNTVNDEAGAEYLQNAEEGAGNVYFNRAAPGATADLYYASVTRDGETRGPAVLISELSHPTATDQGATLRRDAKEIVFFSNRPGGVGATDLWTSTRRNVNDAWSTPVNLGPPINSTAFEQQPNLSDQGRTLLFASTRTGGFGGTDIWISTRTRGSK